MIFVEKCGNKYTNAGREDADNIASNPEMEI